MALKHSSKTATEKSLQAANPRVQVFDKWAGVNFKDAPLGWEYSEPGKFYAHHQTDLQFNNFVIQNNLVTDMSDSVSTRFDSQVVALAPTNNGHDWKFTGVAYLYRHWLFAACRHDDVEEIFYKDINTADKRDWYMLPRFVTVAGYPSGIRIQNEVYEIGSYENMLIALCEKPYEPDPDPTGISNSIVHTCGIAYDEDSDRIRINGQYDRSQDVMASECFVPNPSTAPTIEAVGWANDEVFYPSTPGETPPEGSKAIVRLTFVYTYTNMWGATTQSPYSVIWVSEDPYSFTSSRYIRLRGDQTPDIGINGVDIWVNMDENQNYVLATHIESRPESSNWVCSWFGAMTNTDVYSTSSRTLPQENTTYGPSARHFEHIDSRLYWWGDPSRPYRLLIGGNVGNEMSIARSQGGGWVDIEPGSGFVIQGVCKWKTASGANIVTMLCGHPNTNQVRRFNLVEMTSTFTNEIQVKGWQYEEVSNVVGCNSRWGFGVFADGLYSISRYGLMLTTMAMEYNNQMRNQKVSEVIDPIFTERLGHRLNDARLVHIDGIIYIILSEDNSENEPQNLDRVILCYDTGKKAWYTFTHDGSDGLLLHAMAIDSERHTEGLGIISENAVTLYPTTGIQDTTPPDFDILLETGELCSRIPMQAPYYVEQLEFRFDHFIGKCECEIEGVDYYGRKFKIFKKFGQGTADDPAPTDPEHRTYVEWIRVQKTVEFFRIRIKGPARFRLTHIIAKAYLYNNLIGMPYGFDAKDTFINRHGDEEPIHHYISDYNNLRRAIIA